MSNEHRIYSTKININTDEVKSFYNKRAQRAEEMDCPYTAVLLGDQDPGHAAKWNEFEKQYILPELMVNEKSNVLDIGCGMGRWAEAFIPLCGYYCGVDYSEDMVELAKKRIVIPEKEYDFDCCSFLDLVSHKGHIPKKKFNAVVIAGVCMYINDEELKNCFKGLTELLADNCILYLTETIGNEERLTLNAFYSNALQDNYDVIYRTAQEYNSMYQPLYDKGFEVVKQDYLPKLNKEEEYSETDRWYSILRRRV